MFVISYKKKLILWVKFDLTNRGSNVIIYLLSDKERQAKEKFLKKFEKKLDKPER